MITTTQTRHERRKEVITKRVVVGKSWRNKRKF